MTNDPQIKIDVHGTIVRGDDAGARVVVERYGATGFLIYVTIAPGVGYDNWVKDEDGLAAYFAEAGWRVEWDA